MSELKNRERFGVAVDKQLLEGLRKLSLLTRIPASKLLDEAIEDLLRKYNQTWIRST
jgi:hypothetical protein